MGRRQQSIEGKSFQDAEGSGLRVVNFWASVLETPSQREMTRIGVEEVVPREVLVAGFRALSDVHWSPFCLCFIHSVPCQMLRQLEKVLQRVLIEPRIVSDLVMCICPRQLLRAVFRLVIATKTIPLSDVLTFAYLQNLVGTKKMGEVVLQNLAQKVVSR